METGAHLVEHLNELQTIQDLLILLLQRREYSLYKQR
jgi:hypothetical protein